jgi:hypothetical protein
MAVCHSGRQIRQVPADDEGLGAKLCRSVGDIEALSRSGMVTIGHGHRLALTILIGPDCSTTI